MQTATQAPVDGSSLSLDGPAFSWLIKALATLLIAAIAAKGVQVNHQIDWLNLSAPVLLFGAAAGFIVATGYWSILTSRTSINATHIRQSGLWNKEVVIAQIAQIKLIHYRSIAWLITPRLLVRAGGFGTQTFYCADLRVLHAFAVLAHGSAHLES